MNSYEMEKNMKHLDSQGEIFVGRCGIYILYCQGKNTWRRKGLFEVQKNVRTVKDFGNMGSTFTEKDSNFQWIYSFQKKKDAIRCIIKEEQKDFETEQKLIDFIESKKEVS
jgi:hypothetical protein